MERVWLKVRRKEAVSSFQALLVETIKDLLLCNIHVQATPASTLWFQIQELCAISYLVILYRANSAY
nr:hypothetical protein CFP56_27928 [Quercus suber]